MNGKLRVQVYVGGRMVSAAKVLDVPSMTFPDTRQGWKDAQALEREAEAKLKEQEGQALTLKDFADRWESDPLFARPKESTNLHNAERIRGFVSEYGHLPLASISDEHVAAWLTGGKNLTTVGSLRAMFNDAASAKAGRLMGHNPFSRLGIRKGPGRRHLQPPTEAEIAQLIDRARAKTCPSFTGWLKVACYTGMRPGELDALRWSDVNLDENRIHVRQQWNVKARKFTTPKNGKARTILLPWQAREELLTLPREEFCFTTIRGTHYTPSSRNHHWNRVRDIIERDDVSLYLATRHFAGWWFYNVLEMPSEDVAIQLGHEDGGELVRTLYGHRDKDRALARLEAAANQAGKVVPLRVLRDETG
jgi:integrase